MHNCHETVWLDFGTGGGTMVEVISEERNSVFVTNSDFLNPIFLQLDNVKL